MEAMAVVVAVERAGALDTVKAARALADRDKTWRTEAFGLADGQAVLLGSGLYVNRVLAAGLKTDVTDAHLDLLEDRSRAVGVPPAFEISEYTLRSIAPRLRDRGFRAGKATSSMVRVLDGDLPDIDSSIQVEVVGDTALEVWQAATAEGWGHLSGKARIASDDFARAVSDTQRPGLLLARSVPDGRVSQAVSEQCLGVDDDEKHSPAAAQRHVSKP